MEKKKTVIHIPLLPEMRAEGSSACKKKQPYVVRRSYDLSADICRHGTEAGASPIGVHMRGEGEVPLVRCAVVGGIAVLTVWCVCSLHRVCCAMYYRRKYAKHCAEKSEARYRKKYEKALQCNTLHNSIPQKERRVCAKSADTKNISV